MFDHVKFGVSDYAASKAFFLQALAPLGVTLVGEGEPSYGAELAGSGDASLCLYQSAEKPAPLHIAFRADSREPSGGVTGGYRCGKIHTSSAGSVRWQCSASRSAVP